MDLGAGGISKLTAKGYVKQRLPQFKQRTSKRASSSRTKAAHSRTFEDLLPWEGFIERVNNFTNSLDDMDAIYRPLVSHRCMHMHMDYVSCHVMPRHAAGHT